MKVTRGFAATLASLALLLVAACGSRPEPDWVPVGRVVPSLDAPPPAAPREFRAAWVATVANIDWPSRKGLSSAEQQAEMQALLDRAQALNLNALILQVRPSADAIYPSTLEPWTEFLSGTQGRAPEPAYDPLQQWIAGAHARGIELHAWFNPYRARASSAASEPAWPHVSLWRPELVKGYGDQQWMDPGEPDAAAHTLAVILDVVRRYDIDGVHIDDYFYPYPVQAGGKEVAFPDQPAWQRYRAQGGKLARAEWRRSRVDALVEQIHREVHAAKPWLRFGISPFGIGRPDRRPPGISGFSQFDQLHADVERWLEAGWLDYLAPQLYWPIEQKAQAFGVLFDYWHGVNPQGRHIWPGLFTSKLPKEGTPAAGGWAPQELLAQIELMRARRPAPASGGHAHFSMVALMQNRAGIAALLRTGPYASAALVPASPWLDDQPPAAPVLSVLRLVPQDGSQRLQIRVDAAAGEAPTRHAVWLRERDGQGSVVWRLHVQPAQQPEFELAAAAGQRIDALAVSAVDRVGNESERVHLVLGEATPGSLR